MANSPFARLIAAVATPFSADEQIDLGRLLTQCRWLLAEGCDGVALFATAGEGPSLTVDERRAGLDHLLDNGVSASCLMVGISCSALGDSIALARHATQRGCAGVLVAPPFYYKEIGDAGVLRYFSQLIEKTAEPKLAVYLHQEPQTTLVLVTPEVTRELARRFPATVKGYLDDSGDWDHTETMLADFADLNIYTGTEMRLIDTVRAGGAGCISATANVHPRAIRQMVAGFAKPNSAPLQIKVAACRQAFHGLPVVAAVKAGLARVHDDQGWLRLRAPLTPLDAAQQAELIAAAGI